MLMRKFNQAARQLNRVIKEATDNERIQQRAQFLLDICEFRSTRDDVLLQSLLSRGSEDSVLRELLQKFQIVN